MKTSDLQETFNGGVLNAGVWATYSGTPAVSGSALTLTIASGAANYHGITSVASYDLTSSYVQSELTNAGNQALASLETYPLFLELDANNALMFIVTGNATTVYEKVAGVTTFLNSAAYSTTAHRFFRIRESDNIIYWETSPDKVSWSVLHSKDVATLFAVTSLKIVVLAGVYASEVSGTAITVDNINLTQKAVNPKFVKTSSPYPFSPRRAR